MPSHPMRRHQFTACLVISVVLVTLLTFSGIYVGLWIWPEISMISNSQCRNPLQSWNGKLLNYQIWRNGFEGRPLTHNIHFRGNSSHDRRRLRSSTSGSNNANTTEGGTRIILWGAHHKTGTYLAQKLFSVICARMRWCCIFHPTRDSIDAIHAVFATEPVSVIGHNQWIWYPAEIAGNMPYKFVHFYRQPARKIVSGYRYHRDGAEAWTNAPKPYTDLCQSSLHKMIPTTLTQNNTDSSTSSSSDGMKSVAAAINRIDVVAHCQSVHLCITCCRREHERLDRPHMRRHKASREYALRPHDEYDYLCRHLGGVQGSLRSALLEMPVSQGLSTEAALAFYENLRMARIFNHTQADPNSLNIDIDVLTSDFQGTIMAILKHLELGLPPSDLLQLAQEMDFYNIKRTTLLPFYKWSMSGSLNHLDTSQQSEQKLMAAGLEAQKDYRKVYAPILQLLGAPLSTHPSH